LYYVINPQFHWIPRFSRYKHQKSPSINPRSRHWNPRLLLRYSFSLTKGLSAFIYSNLSVFFHNQNQLDIHAFLIFIAASALLSYTLAIFFLKLKPYDPLQYPDPITESIDPISVQITPTTDTIDISDVDSVADTIAATTSNTFCFHSFDSLFIALPMFAVCGIGLMYSQHYH
jgi:hypothetical protein